MSISSPTSAAPTSRDDHARLDPDNPFATHDTWPGGWPPLDRIDDRHVEQAVRAGIAAQATAITAITTNSAAPSFDNTVVALERSGIALLRVRRVWSLLMATAATPRRHGIEAVLAPLLAAHDDAVLFDAALFARVDSLYARRDELDLDVEDLALLERTHRRFVRAGACLDPVDQARLRDLNQREAELETVFGDRLSSGVDAAAVHVTDPAELDGLDIDEIAAAAPRRRRPRAARSPAHVDRADHAAGPGPAARPWTA